MSIIREPWSIVRGDSPVVAVAIHGGHDMSDEVRAAIVLDEQTRLREEDPCTPEWAEIAPNRVMLYRSRFEIELNRGREQVLYRNPSESWGHTVWRDGPPRDVYEAALQRYDRFYGELEEMLREAEKRHGRFVVLDLHAYCHRRGGPDRPPAPAEDNPEINVGTGSMPRDRWAALVDRFINDLRSFDFLARGLDVRENVRFRGGNVCRFVHRTFPETGCALAVEVKKLYIDEWTGEIQPETVRAVRAALEATVPGLVEELA